jgi:hypothetical protein
MAHATKADAADAETAHIATGAPSTDAAVLLTRRKFRIGCVLALVFAILLVFAIYES